MKRVTRIPKGCKELNVQDQAVFDLILGTAQEVYKDFGYQHLDTSLMQDLSYLTEEDSVKQEIYKAVRNKGNEDEASVGLRFDLTKPFARYVSEKSSELTFPYKRWDSGLVFRGERPQKGRQRQFVQCDFDVVNKKSLSYYYDVEVIQVVSAIMEKLVGKNYEIRINHRGLVNDVLDALGVDSEASVAVFLLLDKYYKLDKEDFLSKLSDIIGENKSEELVRLVEFEVNSLEDLNAAREATVLSKLKSSENLETLLFYYESGVTPKFDFSIVRGLGYYTGFVIETFVTGSESIGSVFSGGRYDNLVTAEQKIPGVGASIGVSRIAEVILEMNKLVQKDDGVLIALVNPTAKDTQDAAALARTIPKANIIAITSLKTLGKFLKNANYTQLVSKDGTSWSLKDLQSGEKTNFDLFDDLVSKIR